MELVCKGFEEGLKRYRFHGQTAEFDDFTKKLSFLLNEKIFNITGLHTIYPAYKFSEQKAKHQDIARSLSVGQHIITNNVVSKILYSLIILAYATFQISTCNDITLRTFFFLQFVAPAHWRHMLQLRHYMHTCNGFFPHLRHLQRDRLFTCRH